MIYLPSQKASARGNEILSEGSPWWTLGRKAIKTRSQVDADVASFTSSLQTFNSEEKARNVRRIPYVSPIPIPPVLPAPPAFQVPGYNSPGLLEASSRVNEENEHLSKDVESYHTMDAFRRVTLVDYLGPPNFPEILPSFASFTSSNWKSTGSRIPEDVLQDGDAIGPGLYILGQPISIVISRSTDLPTLQVIRKLGTGSYAVVYLVQEMTPISSSTLDGSHSNESLNGTESPRDGGKYYALKCLAKHAQEQDAQLLEAIIHQSLPTHPNVVTLWMTLETASYLLLVLDYVPGQDLFYFLEQAQDYVDFGSPFNVTPLTPTFLASLHPDQILSYDRLRLVASIFSQMCDALAHCHRNSVYHRDIKPENFFVTDGWAFNERTGEKERKVQVKLTDFGLATRDAESGDLDCGSAPYMSYECHNNITPTYATAPADVWSLGIDLINLIYHANPWLSTARGSCQSFECFLQDPRNFFMEKFPGMTLAVAEFFSRRVFCLLESPSKHAIHLPSQCQLFVGQRITAEEFGVWARDLHLHLGPSARRKPAFPPSLEMQQPSPSQPRTHTSFRVQPSPQPVAYSKVHQSGTIGAVDSESEEENDLSASMNSLGKRRKRGRRGPPGLPVCFTPIDVSTEAALYKASILAPRSQIGLRKGDEE